MGNKLPYLYIKYNSRAYLLNRFGCFDQTKRLQNGFKSVTIWLQFESKL